MAQFIIPEDYDASIHQEILDALIRSDRQIIEICEDRAVAEMRGYLSARYDCDRVFSAEGDERNQLVLMMALDIAIYHIFPSTTRATCRKSASTATNAPSNGSKACARATSPSKGCRRSSRR